MPKQDAYDRLRKLQEENPQEFIRLLRELDKKNVQPHPAQVPVLKSKARFKIMCCGRRFGKTVIASKLAIQATRKENQMVWWVAPTYRVVKRGYEEILRQLPPDVLAKPAPPDSHFDAGRQVVLHFKNGSRMEFFSAERPEGMLGAAVDYVVLDEAATMPARVWNQVIYPTLGDRLGKALLISTPRGHNWFYYEWLRGQDESETDYESWTFRTQDNPLLPEGEADRMAAMMPQMEADQEIYAKWIAAGSSVFILEPFSIEDKKIQENGIVSGFGQNLKGTVFLGIDLARTNDWTVLYGTMEDTRQNVYFERMQAIAWAEQRRRIRRAVATLRRNGAAHVTLLVDEGNAGSVIVEDLMEAGYDVVGVNFTTHKANMVRLLANDLEAGKAFVLSEKISEFNSYQMDQTKSGKLTYSAPDGQHDDVVSAKMLSHWGCVNYGSSDFIILSPNVPESLEEPDERSDQVDDEFDDYSDFELTEDEILDQLAEGKSPEEMTPYERAVRGWF